jgi:selenocysteine lyase/cysteine desulfurase
VVYLNTASQATGAIPIDVRACGVDFLATPSHKFLCGTRGMGYLYVREGLLPLMRPIAPGWKAAAEPMKSFFGPDMHLSTTASKLDMSLAWFAALGDRAALNIFEQFGADQLFETNRQLIRHLRRRLKEGGFSVPEPEMPVQSTIVSIALVDPESVLRRLAQAGVVISVRSGRLRISVHFYNSVEDLDMLANLLAGSANTGGAVT